MGRKQGFAALRGIAAFLITMVSAAIVFAADVPRMTKEQLKAQLGNPDLTIVDVRVDKDWTKSDQKIIGAVRQEPKLYREWAAQYPKEKTLVLYCA